MGTYKNKNECKICGYWMPLCKCTKSEGTAVHIFKPMIYRDICETPILIESKQHLRRECKKHGVIAARLM